MLASPPEVQVVSVKGLLGLLLLRLVAATLQFVVPSQESLASISRVLEVTFLALATATFRVTRSRMWWSALTLLSALSLALAVQLGSRQQGQLPRQRLSLFLIMSLGAWARLNLVTRVLRPGAEQQSLAASTRRLLPPRQVCKVDTLLMRLFVDVMLRRGLPTTSRL